MSKSNEFQNEIGTLLSSLFKISHRIDDASSNRYGTFQVSKKPFDYFGSDNNGKLWGAEVKRVKTVRFPLRNIPKHQRKALEEVQELSGNGWLFINWRTKRAGVAVWIDYGLFSKIESEVERKSLKPEDFPKECFLTRISGGWIAKEHYIADLL